MKIAKALLVLALSTLACLAGAVETLSVGITPLKPASKLAEEWGPLLDEIGRRAGVRLVFRTAPNIPAFGERLAQGEYDLAYMNPYHYSLYGAKPGYRALAREKDRPLEGIIIVRKDSPYRQLKDLQGATLIFPTPLAFAASILTQAELRRQGIDIKARYVQSHDSVFRGVASGGFDGGGTILKVFQTTDPEQAKQLRVLAKTASYRSHPLARHPRVAPDTGERIQRALLDLDRDETGRKLLAGVAFLGFEAATDKDYNDVRALEIDKLIEAVQ